MGLFEAIFLGGLVAVVIAQVIHRGAGAVLAVIWCLAALGFGWMEMANGTQVRFFGMAVDRYMFVAVMSAMAIYNTWVAARHFRGR